MTVGDLKKALTQGDIPDSANLIMQIGSDHSVVDAVEYHVISNSFHILYESNEEEELIYHPINPV